MIQNYIYTIVGTDGWEYDAVSITVMASNEKEAMQKAKKLITKDRYRITKINVPNNVQQTS